MNKPLLLVFFFLVLFDLNLFSQTKSLYIYWGWNRANYTSSTVHFKDANYDFELYKLSAKDKPSPFSFSSYFGIKNITIPQYNVRIGYFITDRWSISIGTDHMKYVIIQNQKTTIEGEIHLLNSPYNKIYHKEALILDSSFLKMEHTDGLNFVNMDGRRDFKLFTKEKLDLRLILGVGGGIMIPRSDVTLLSQPRNDEFHLAGWGCTGFSAIKIKYSGFFIMNELKVGYINLSDILVDQQHSGRASQAFGFFQYNLLFGYQFRLGH